MFKLSGRQLEIPALSPEESLDWRYTLGSHVYMDAFKSMILNEITEGKSVQRHLGPTTGTAAFKGYNKKVTAKRPDKEVPER